jgi:FKBP-type peptidyl-prolyl cis-trans isomerase FkpA
LFFKVKFANFAYLKTNLFAMKKFIRTVLFISIIIFVVFHSSCINNSITERTEQIERAEIESLLARLTAEDFDIDTTDLGVYYIVYAEGEGEPPVSGDTISIEYVGAFISGNIFETSEDYYKDGIWEFVYLEELVIPGLNDALSIMKKGGEIDAIIPSEFAYGETGYGPVNPYTTLIFNIKLHEIKRKAEGS